jgi:peptide/nickel transport system permease protein
MLGYLLRRILAAIPVMGVVALFVFLLLRLTPGDPAAILAGDNATPEQLERIRTSLGLNEPLYTQFFTWIGKLLHGDLGVSLISNKPVIDLISNRVEPSISIALPPSSWPFWSRCRSASSQPGSTAPGSTAS